MRGWLLSFNLAMLSIILVLVIILFSLVFSLMEEMQTRNSRYEALNTLSGHLMQSRLLFQNIAFEKEEKALIELRLEFESVNKNVQTSLQKLAIEHGQDRERYFLHRGISNGVVFINERIEELKQLDDGIDFFNLYYTIDRVYTYLQDYTFNHYLSAVVEADVAWIKSTQGRITDYRTITILLLLLISVCYIFAVYKMTMSLVKPVNTMVKTAKEIFHGTFDGPPIPISGPEELNYLQQSMNQMRQSLKERLEMIEANTQLEKTIHVQEVEQLRTTRELEKARYKALQSQINPHFLFNTLNTISRTALFENANTTVDLLDSLASIFRYTLEYHDDVTLKQELEFVREYLTIQQFRFKERLHYSIRCHQDFEEVRLPPLVIQPFVENAMIHGLEPKIEGGTISIAVQSKDKHLHITIEDSGVGITKNKTTSTKKQNKQHIGIQNISDRLDLYYKGKSSVLIERISEEGGTRVVILLPYELTGGKRVHTTDS